MKTWLKELERELKKRFYLKEVEDILSYYEEMIQERIDSGEDIDDILSDYDPKEIAKSMTTDVVMKRANDTYTTIAKSSKQLMLFLLSTPLLIPLGFAYIIILIVFGSIMISLVSVVFASLVAMIGIFINMYQSGLGQNEILAIIGVSLIVFSFLILITLWLYQAIRRLAKSLIQFFSKLAKDKEGKR
ncbi:MAG: hypothetical protein CVV61_07645 [Tenericutes bacterium HGW-Tenericutes-6]|nr:MAG: hypothetical protein CVV61_07645 [Tenericutes bacterium HGW-Tenericutes-6]PKK97265.1 MAG: hypothetical protein CVV58_02150 [Tenericutes bacterium HGW-Tenericutes-3]